MPRTARHVLFQHTMSQPHAGSWHMFFQAQCLSVLITVFVFWPGNSTTSSLFLFFVLFWSGNFTWKTFFATCCQEDGLLTLAHALLRICLHVAHGLLTLAHALLALCSARQGSFWILYIPIKSSRSSSWVLTRICAQCSRLAHGLLTVCPRCSRFAHPLGDEVFFLMKSHATFNLFRAMCT